MVVNRDKQDLLQVRSFGEKNMHGTNKKINKCILKETSKAFCKVHFIQVVGFFLKKTFECDLFYLYCLITIFF